ncbi:MAG: hypothetical protein JJU36_17230 [Phycisphaeraceae bacterium]|nr:hypothetical protein [Phycisphaeraceae bacterium]
MKMKMTPNFQPRPDRRMSRAAVPCIMLLVLGLTGCATGPAWVDREPGHRYRHTTLEQEAGWSASEERTEAEYARLPTSIARAVRQMEWGLLRIDGWEKNPTLDPLPETGVFRAWALTPEGRRVTILAGPPENLDVAQDLAQPTDSNKGQIAITARVGHFGDQELERRFLQALEAELHTRDQPPRFRLFLLPRMLTDRVLELLDP